MIRLAGILVCLALAVTASGCGDKGDSSSANSIGSLERAKSVDVTKFPKADGSATLRELAVAAESKSDLVFVPAGTNFIAGTTSRVPFALFDEGQLPVWGPTVVYVAATARAVAKGPFVATGHTLVVSPEFESVQTKNDPDPLNGFYATQVPLDKRRNVQLLTITDTGNGLRSSISTLGVRPIDSVPAVGSKPPAIDTPTEKSVKGKLEKIDTRRPPDQMHKVSFKAALKQKQPIVLVFATPQFCTSRICGPIVDVLAELQPKYKDRVNFIHQEIFIGNDPKKGYLKQVGQFGLPSEPFTFVIGKDGRVVARFEAPVSTKEVEQALAQALG